MQAIVWLISGLLAGWLARLVMKEERVAFLADVTLGILGGISGAWMLRSVGGSVPPAESPMHLLPCSSAGARYHDESKSSDGEGSFRSAAGLPGQSEG